jgi:hypothetical protein
MIPSFYFLSTAVKIHEAWVLGAYFTSVATGLPWFPKWSVPLITNQLIFMEMVGAWYLLSSRKYLQRFVAAYFVFFHLYSGIIVGYRYPTIVLPMVVIVFVLFYQHQRPPFTRKALIGWVLVAVWFVMQSIPFFIAGDQKFTLEANRIGLYMFESNHQCVSTVTYYYKDKTTSVVRRPNGVAWNRCDPFDSLQRIQHRCAHSSKPIERAEWTFDHSINGNPFLRQVSVPNACDLKYTAWEHNTWIRTQKEAEVVGYPKENGFY